MFVVSSSIEDPNKKEFTRKRTWKTTTRETVSIVKKETRSELEVFVVDKSLRSKGYILDDDEPMTERLDIQVKSSAVLPRGRFKLTQDLTEKDQNTELVVVEGQETRNEIQHANEKICLKIEHTLGHKGRYLTDLFG